MTRAGTLLLIMLACVVGPAAAQDYVREELQIPMAAAGPRGLEALLVRPAGSRRYPLALLSHGAPRDVSTRPGMTPNTSYPQALEFARRGFAALIVMRRGYGTSDGAYAEDSGPCGNRDYMIGARASARDLRAAVAAMQDRRDVTTDGMIAVGVSAGGFASIALAADPPPGLAAVISFAGGRGSRGPNDVCDEDKLVRAFGTMGRTARVPMLWVYAENDTFFGPDLAQRLHAAFTRAGGDAEMIAAAAFGEDGHFLFSSAGRPVWTPMVDAFLRQQNLGNRTIAAAPAPALLAPPRQLNDSGRTAFTTYLAAGMHKAFAVSPRGGYGYRTGRRSAEEAQEQAIETCSKNATGCEIYAVDDALVGATPKATPAGPSTEQGSGKVTFGR